jgi:hypothetical protein
MNGVWDVGIVGAGLGGRIPRGRSPRGAGRFARKIGDR